MIRQHTVEPHPLGAPERMALIARVVDKDRNPEPLKHLLHLGRVQYHQRLDGEIAALRREELVVRRAVLSRKAHGTARKRLLRRVNVPALRPRAGKADIAERTVYLKEAHRRRRREVDAIQRLL